MNNNVNRKNDENINKDEKYFVSKRLFNIDSSFKS